MFFNYQYFKFVILTISTIVFLWCSSLVLAKSIDFPITKVKVVSSYDHIDKGVLQNIVSPYIKNGFFNLNVVGLKQDLLKLPWVYSVLIKRQWPDTLLIKVIEQNPVLQVDDKGLINSKGVFFAPPQDTFPKDLPIIFGLKGSPSEILSLYKQANDYFDKLDLVIKSITFYPSHYLEILLSNETIIYLKEQNPLEQIKLLLSSYGKVMANHEKPPKCIDLRYDAAGMAVKWE